MAAPRENNLVYIVVIALVPVMANTRRCQLCQTHIHLIISLIINVFVSMVIGLSISVA